MLLVASIVLSFPLVILAQTTTVQCTPDFDWMSNDRSQNPCLVAAYLQQSCVTSGGNWNVGPLPEGNSYTGPRPEGANQCTCSGLVYNLVSACAACQEANWTPWSRWTANCTSSVITAGSWPREIPTGTSIPAWAYIDPRPLDTFNVSGALQLADAPESTPIPLPTSSSSTTSAIVVTSLVSVTPTVTPTVVPQDSGSKVNVGAIAGGVVGGVLGLVLVVGLAIVIIRRRERGPDLSPIEPFHPPTPGLDLDSSVRTYTSSAPMTQRLYDPNDPSTYPAGPMNYPVYTGASSYPTAASNATMSSHARYPGVAEV